jgi:hypothetical protein
MLIPRKVKHRKQHRPKRKGMASGGTAVTFGDWGIQALEPAYVSNRQIESGAYRDQPAHPSWREDLDQRLPGHPDDQEAGRGPHGFR